VLATLIARFCVPATEPVATRAARSAYSTMSWPDSSCEKRAKHGTATRSVLGFRIGSFKGFLPWRFGVLYLDKSSTKALTPHSHERGKREGEDWLQACGVGGRFPRTQNRASLRALIMQGIAGL
jgi:hypothetical protein